MTYGFDLILTEIAYSDSGTYICEAENENGKAANLTVVRVVGRVYFNFITYHIYQRTNGPVNAHLISEQIISIKPGYK